MCPMLFQDPKTGQSEEDTAVNSSEDEVHTSRERVRGKTVRRPEGSTSQRETVGISSSCGEEESHLRKPLLGLETWLGDKEVKRAS